MEDIMYASQHLPVPSASEVQAVSCGPYPFGDGEWSNEPVMQFPGALQSQVPSA